MEKVLYYFLLDVPQAATIWLALMGLALVAGVGLIARPSRDGPGHDVAVREAELRRARLVTRAQELSRYAEEVAVAADRAAATARRRRDEWLVAQEEVEATWQAYEVADAAARRVAAAAVLPEPRTPRTPAEYADRERYLHRAAMAACCRKELSVLELSEVLAHRNGWDPRRHPVEQEIVLRRAVRDGLLAAQRAAADRERAAWRTAEISLAAARSLRVETLAAAGRAGWVRHRLMPADRPSCPTGGAAQRSRPAVWWRAARVG